MDKINCDMIDPDNPNIDDINTCLSSLLSLSCQDFTDYTNNVINNMIKPSDGSDPIPRDIAIAMIKNTFVDTITTINSNTKLISNVMKLILSLTDNLNCAVNTINSNPALNLSRDEQLPIIDLSSVHKDIADIVCMVPKSNNSIIGKKADIIGNINSFSGSSTGKIIIILFIILIGIIIYLVYKKKQNTIMPVYSPNL